MLDVILLGRGGMYPLPGRHLTSLLVKYQGQAVLVDCGEGTQVALRAQGQGFKQIGMILLTHLHGDHITGLPGLLSTIGNSGREERLVIIGPKGTGHVVSCLQVAAPQLPYEVLVGELDFSLCRSSEASQPRPVHGMGDLLIWAQPVEHGVPCFSYRFDVKRHGKFDAQKARMLDIPLSLWSQLQKGEPVAAEDGRSFRPEDVVGPDRKGIRLTYATDMRPSAELIAFAEGSDLFICEGQYGDPEKQEKALEFQHCMFAEAARMARDASASELWLTHFSPSMPDPEEWIPLAREIFPKASVDKDHAELVFT